MATDNSKISPQKENIFKNINWQQFIQVFKFDYQIYVLHEKGSYPYPVIVTSAQLSFGF